MGSKKNFLSVLYFQTSAFVPELQKLSGPQASKAAGKQANKKKGRGDVVNDDVDEAAGDEEANENEKSKKGRKPKGQGKRASAKRKSKESDDEDKDSDDDADDDDDHQDEDQKKKTRKGVNNKQSKAEKTSKAKVQTSQSGKKLKKGKQVATEQGCADQSFLEERNDGRTSAHSVSFFATLVSGSHFVTKLVDANYVAILLTSVMYHMLNCCFKHTFPAFVAPKRVVFL